MRNPRPPVPNSGRRQEMPRGLAAIALIVIALVVGAAVALWRSRTPPTRVTAVLPDAPGITVGSPVEYRGIRVGSIEEVHFTEAAVVLTLRLDRTDLPLRNTDRVEVRTRSVAERAIAIVPSRDAGRDWLPGDTLHVVPADTLGARREAERALRPTSSHVVRTVSALTASTAAPVRRCRAAHPAACMTPPPAASPARRPAVA